MISSSDIEYMARAIRLARYGLYTTHPNPRVGCVLVRDGAIVGEGWHERAGGPHAEVNALAQAAERSRGATAYVSLEPCAHHGRTPPCSQALIAAGVSRVVVANDDPNPLVAGQGVAELRAAGITVETGVLSDQAAVLNPGFMMRMREGRPYVRCKLAMSLDARTAMASGESKWITSSPARQDVHRLRARSSAILTGLGTVIADDPSLTVRLEAATGGIDPAQVMQPLRVVLDPALEMPTAARLLHLPGRTVVMTAREDAQASALATEGVQIEEVPGTRIALDLAAVLQRLAGMQINEVLVEAGATLSGAFLQAGLIDELIVYMAPLIMGNTARGLMNLPGLERMQDRVELEIEDVRAVGLDWRITARPRVRS